jgi:hypothetical protein
MVVVAEEVLVDQVSVVLEVLEEVVMEVLEQLAPHSVVRIQEVVVEEEQILQ